jgi:hypothetical protein
LSTPSSNLGGEPKCTTAPKAPGRVLHASIYRKDFLPHPQGTSPGYAPSMISCEQLPGDTSKTEQAMELVDDLASLQTRKRKKKKKTHSDDHYAF